MNRKHLIPDIREAIKTRDKPAVTMWNRMEGRPRHEDFSRALKVEVRDALWMLARQWQMGEFKGNDTGSPVLAKLHVTTSPLTKYQAGQHSAECIESEAPLESKVERRLLPLKLAGNKMALDLRLLMGRQWLKLVNEIGDYAQEYLRQYPIELPDQAHVRAHPEVWQTFAAVAGRCMDGGALYEYLTSAAGRHASDNVAISLAHKAAIDSAGDKYQSWYGSLFYQPLQSGADAWEPDRLEYQFKCSAPSDHGEKVLAADEYYHGHLDWYNLDIDSKTKGLDVSGEMTEPGSSPGTDTKTMIPSPVAFEGMPNSRWWAFEDRTTNFGDIKPDKTDLAKLMLIEFGLVYSNDWFVIPYTPPSSALRTGALVDIRGLMVTNVFDEHFWIEAAGRGTDDDWQRWSMFALSTKGQFGEKADTNLLLLPTVPKVQEGEPIEEVLLLRDEITNMVWGVERRVPLASGISKRGAEAARELVLFLQKPLIEEFERLQNAISELEKVPASERSQQQKDDLVRFVADLKKIQPPKPLTEEFERLQKRISELGSIPEIDRSPDQIRELVGKVEELKRIQLPVETPKIRYQVMNTVPEHWIPFIPVHLEGDNRQVQLQRAAMLRFLEWDPDHQHPKKVRPRTALLRQGLDQSPRQAYFIHEEEVPRAGVQVTQAFQRTRWHNGRTLVWLGIKKQVGRGEGASGLVFDQIIHVEQIKP
jgi:hypothetical protein